MGPITTQNQEFARLDRFAKETLDALPQNPSPQQIATALKKIALQQQELGRGSESPAIVKDPNGKLFASWGYGRRTNNPGEPAVIACLRAAAKDHKLHEFKNHSDFEVYLIGSEKQFDAPGGIYNYAPSKVYIVEMEGSTSSYLPVREDHWQEAQKHRGCEYEVIAAGEEEDTSTLDMNTPKASIKYVLDKLPDPKQPQFVQELMNEWRNITIPMNEDGSGLDVNSDMAKNLMAALHQAACNSVKQGGGPFSAAIVSPEGRVISFGGNQVVEGEDATAHGEVSAIRAALEALANQNSTLENWDPKHPLKGYSLVTSSAPCISCTGCIGAHGFARMYYGNTKETVESNSIFTEGPTALGYLENLGIKVEQIAVEDELALKPFKLFNEGLETGTSASYLARE